MTAVYVRVILQGRCLWLSSFCRGPLFQKNQAQYEVNSMIFKILFRLFDFAYISFQTSSSPNPLDHFPPHTIMDNVRH